MGQAVDIKIYLEICCDSDINRLQHCIDALCQWSNLWQLTLSVGKCFHMRVGFTKLNTQPIYTINNVALNTVSALRDLGVLMDSHLSFASHVKNIVSKAHIRSNQILRCFISKDRECLVKAFITYVRPILEYCSVIWNPYHITLINKLESVQRSFTKRLTGLYNMSYEERCAKLGLERLELRRLKTDLIYSYKIIHGLTCLPVDDFFVFSTFSTTRGNSLKLCVPVSRINCRLNFFSVRIIHIWNNLSDNVVNARNVLEFTNSLNNNILLVIFIRGKA